MDSRQTNYLPVLLLFIAAVFSLTPVPFAGNDAVMPSFTLITVFYWSLLRPSQLPVIAIFICGLILDAFTAPALGMNILTLMAMRLLVMRYSSRFARQTIWFFWAGFWIASLPCWLLYWLMADFLLDNHVSAWPALAHWGFTALWYPLLHLAFTRCIAILPHAR